MISSLDTFTHSPLTASSSCVMLNILFSLDWSYEILYTTGTFAIVQRVS